MKLSKRDGIFILVLLAVLILVFTGTRKKLGPDVPETNEHLDFYRQLAEGGHRIDLEQGCVFCHAPDSLPEAHPHKEECMVCHRRK